MPKYELIIFCEQYKDNFYKICKKTLGIKDIDLKK